MNSYRHSFDLVSTDGRITKILGRTDSSMKAEVEIEKIPPYFLGFDIDKNLVYFNLKSTLAQLGVDITMKDLELDPRLYHAHVLLEFHSFNEIGKAFLKEISEGAYVGKLFAADPRRLVKRPNYITRLLGRSDHNHKPLLLLSEKYKQEQIIEQPEKNRTIARIPLQEGYWVYDDNIMGFLNTIARGLQDKTGSLRKFLYLHQVHHKGPRVLPEDGMLLVRTMSMILRTMFARVALDELPEGIHHAKADVLESSSSTGDIYEFHSQRQKPPQTEIHSIPLEFYTLEPFREFVFFNDRDQLQDSLEDLGTLFKAFSTAPHDKHAAAYIVKGTHLQELTKSQWLISDPPTDDPLIIPPKSAQEKMIYQRFLESQASFPILDSMQDNSITSQGVLFTNFFPAPQLKSLLLSDRVGRYLKAIYFTTPSQRYGDYFSFQDRSLLYDLAKVNIDVFWVDKKYNLLLKYVPRRGCDSGVFVPVDRIKEFENATVFGIYGSKLDSQVEYFDELRKLFKGVLEMRSEVDHFLLNSESSIAISTGGGPGAMNSGNKVAQECGLLSIGHAVNFKKAHENQEILEEMNPNIQAKQTYRLENIILRQAEFHLDFPIFLLGGVGTDFELALELLRTQVMVKQPTPILLFGEPEYWRSKITPLYCSNIANGTTYGSEWTSNVFFCVQTAEQALSVYYQYFTGTLEIGPDYPASEEGFVTIA